VEIRRPGRLAGSAEAGVGNAREWRADTTPVSNAATRSTIAITQLTLYLSGRMQVLAALRRPHPKVLKL
jgi:hypothetical protein